MALFEEQITDTLETGAPPIKYEGDQGPKSPQEERMAQLKEEYMQYVFEQKEIDEPIMSFEEWYQAVYQASKMGVDASQQPQQPQPQPQPQMRQPVAYGGIMDLGGRRRYGWGSKIKSRIRKLIPNEAADIAVKAAPFVAPFNPIAAGLMAGVGGFDRHGSISKGLKSGLLTYGGGQAARYLGGANMQTGFNPMGGFQPGTTMGTGIGQYFSKPTGVNPTGFNKWFGGKSDLVSPGNTGREAGILKSVGVEAAQEQAKKSLPAQIMKKITDSKLSTKAMMAILGGSAAAGMYTKKHQGDDSIEQMRGKGMDIEGIRAEVIEAFKDPTGKKLEEIRIKYPYLGAKETKNIDIMAQGGRAGYYAGGQSTPSDYTMEDAMMTTTQDKLGGITDVMKQADLYRQGSVGQMYAAQGGRIGYAVGTGSPPVTTGQNIQAPGRTPGPPAQRPNPMPVVGNPMMRGMNNPMARGMNPMMGGMNPMMGGMNPMMNRPMMGGMNPMMGGRRMAQEGGLMDLGGMEKDYRQDGGFVPIGGKEKADDVPARLSKNEFVFTADAVRGAGGGDIDRGAEVMGNIMKNLEQGGQISEETQGLDGAREMFDVSERLSEVV